MPDETEKMMYQNHPEAGAAESNMVMKGEIWMTTNENSLAGSRIPFTKEEKEFLCELIQKHVYSKFSGCAPEAAYKLPPDGSGRRSSISAYCRVPNTAWKSIEEEYNGEESVRKRSIKQLRKCWENLKHRGKINPEALFSGKRLQGTTSLTGGFHLSAAENENGEEQENEQCSQKDEIRNIYNSTPQNENDVSNDVGSDSDETMNVGTGNVFLNSTSVPSTQPSYSKYKAINEIADSIIKRSASSESVGHDEPSMTSLTYVPHIPSATSSRPTMVTPRITAVRTVRSLKPTQHLRRYPSDRLSRANASRAISNLAQAGKSHAQRIHEMKVKLLAARIKEHEVNVQKVNLQMQQAQAHHDVTMRLLRTKAAWYDANLQQLEKQLQSGEMSLVGEEETEYVNNISDQEDEMRYAQDYQC